MRRRLMLTGIAVLVCGGAMLLGGTAGWNLYKWIGPQPVNAIAPAKEAGEAKVLGVLTEMQRSGGIRFGVPEADGRRLRLLAEAAGAKNVIEVGTSTGYSTLWLGLAVRRTGGHVTTYEIDPGRAEAARENFRRAGVDDHITIVLGDAHKTLAPPTELIDVVFLDADKDGYLDYLEKLLPAVRRGGLILAHNAKRAPGYVERVSADPELDTVFLTHGSGMAVTLYKR